jgi:pimeloyl-ACP methyl ester carboxylesterase
MSPGAPGRRTSMRTHLLISGAGGDAWYWHRVVPLLEAAGHRAVAFDLPAGDDTAGLDAYVDAALAALHRDPGSPADGEVIVVGQSLGGFTAAVVADRIGAAGLVFVAAMIPAPGETPEGWWASTGFSEVWGDQEMDDEVHFLHDLPHDMKAELLTHEFEQSGRVMEDAFPLAALPAVPTRGIAATNDRFFPVAFMDQLIRDRLGVEPEHVESGHLPALANPEGLAALLLA